MKQDILVEREVISFIVEKAKLQLKPKQILLFGSRARGDASARSDYDFAFYAPEAKHEDWAQFAEYVRENSPTLSHLDLVWMDHSPSPELVEQINKFNVKLYESKSS